MVRYNPRYHVAGEFLLLRHEPISPEKLVDELLVIGTEFALTTAQTYFEDAADEEEREFWTKVRLAISDPAFVEHSPVEELEPDEEANEMIGCFGETAAYDYALHELGKEQAAGRKDKIAHWEQVCREIERQLKVIGHS
jgi:hypothetical protein